MAHSASVSPVRQGSLAAGGLFPRDPRISRLVLCLAVLDLGIWSYVAVAVHLPPAPTLPAVSLAMSR